MFILNILQSTPDIATALLLLCVIVFGFLIAITVHEFAHGYVANKFGDPTAKIEGRLSLNPLSHIDPIGAIMFFLVGFGWAKPVPVNTRLLNNKTAELKVAAAGIVANLALATILGVPLRIAGYHHILIDSSVLLQILNLLVNINLMLIAFNVLPIPPLDGSHFVEYFLSEEQKIKFERYGQYALFGMIFLSIFGGLSIFSLIMEPIIRILSLLVVGTFAFTF